MEPFLPHPIPNTEIPSKDPHILSRLDSIVVQPWASAGLVWTAVWGSRWAPAAALAGVASPSSLPWRPFALLMLALIVDRAACC